jgi:hypothetical protein
LSRWVVEGEVNIWKVGGQCFWFVALM